jgi:hypothetical protein
VRVERRAAIHQLVRALFNLHVGVLASTERAVIIAGGNVWHAVYRFDGPGFQCWDFFHDQDNPEWYEELISDQLVSTAEVVGKIRRMCG